MGVDENYSHFTVVGEAAMRVAGPERLNMERSDRAARDKLESQKCD